MIDPNTRLSELFYFLRALRVEICKLAQKFSNFAFSLLNNQLRFLSQFESHDF